MPLATTTTQKRLNSIAKCMTAAIDALQILADTLKSPFLQPILNTSRSLLSVLQNVRQHKTDCVDMTEKISTLLYAIISVHMEADGGADLSPSMLHYVGKFTETVQKIHVFVEAQGKFKMRHLFRQGDMSTLLEECRAGLQYSLDTLTIDTDMQEYSEEKHQQVLEFIASISDRSFDRASSLWLQPIWDYSQKRTKPKL
ncbi:hypothetical protein C8R43DRAFT_1144242 [Mycena crocata]|nr:hypothetical protein C8R43DRAFT_1144242 [Mycena crocata]